MKIAIDEVCAVVVVLAAAMGLVRILTGALHGPAADPREAKWRERMAGEGRQIKRKR